MRITWLTDVHRDFAYRRGVACVVRYGGIGDVIQATSVFPGIKAEGYQLTVNCDHRGLELLRHDPHIDELLVQESGFVPEPELEAYWSRLRGGFERFVNLSGSVEGALLAHPAYPQFYWPKEQRHREMNRNYLEHVHEIAGVPPVFAPRFYPTPREHARAARERRRMGRGPVVLWSLSGSSFHKAYPHTDEVVRRFLALDAAHRVVFVGDTLCQVLEHGWNRKQWRDRVLRRSGRWNIRRTLTFAEHADVVVGPETGVMNAVGHLDVPKVCLLSHSSVENLTKHWRHTTSMTPYLAFCHPCHKLHHHSRTCVRDEPTGGALCASVIDPTEVLDAICAALNRPREAAA